MFLQKKCGNARLQKGLSLRSDAKEMNVRARKIVILKELSFRVFAGKE
jgi:hypothetical protein